MTSVKRTKRHVKRPVRLPLKPLRKGELFPIRPALIDTEERLHNIVLQCDPRIADPLFANFRYDEICRALTQFKARGLTLIELFAFQRCVPVVYPWNVEYDNLRQDANRRFNVFPLLIVMAKTVQDVVRAFKFSRKYNIAVVARSGAHSAEGWSLNEGMVLDQSRRTEIVLDPETGVCTFEAGCLLGPIAAFISPYHLCLSSGSCPNNCIAGFTLGGGIGLYSRQLGINSDKLLEVETLLADGYLVKANQSENQNLYWASRGGGGGNYGIVTSLTIQLSPYSTMFTVLLQYPFPQFKDVFRVWQSWAPYTDPALTTEFRSSDGQRSDGSTFFTITGVFFASPGKDEAYLRNLLTPVLSVGTPEVSIKETDFAGSLREFAGNGRTSLFVKVKNSFITQQFPDDGIDIMIRHLMQGDGQSFFDFDAMGGAINNLSSTDTAFPYRQGTILWMLMTWRWNVQSEAPGKIAAVTSFYDDLSPYFPVPGQVYVNQPDITLTDYLQKYYDGNLPRLVQTKQQYDPTNVFSYPQSIPTSL